MSAPRSCKICGGPLTLESFAGYVHTDRATNHLPVPVRQIDSNAPVWASVSTGYKHPSGQAALFTEGDGKPDRAAAV